MTTLRRGARGEDVVRLQSLLVAEGHPLGCDGRYGPATERAVREFQRARGLVVDGIAGPMAWIALATRHSRTLQAEADKSLRESDLVSCAAALGVDLVALKAVLDVEAAGSGFLGGRPKILFEPHVFWRSLKRAGIDPHKVEGCGDILYPSWNPHGYLGGLREWDRLDRARVVDFDAASESASWGLFQVLGQNWRDLGYLSVDDFVSRHDTHERDHLEGFRRYVEVNGLLPALRAHDWATFARKYNGPGYARNGYDRKLATAHKRHARAEAAAA